MKVERRLKIEKQIREKLVDELLADGYRLSIDNGEDITPYMTDAAYIKEILGAVDEEHIFAKRGPKENYMVFLVYGNSGYDVICDYSCALEYIVEKLNPLIETFEKEYHAET